MSFDHLHKRIKARKCPLAVELGLSPGELPPQLLESAQAACSDPLEGAAQAVRTFDLELLEALAGLVPAVVFPLPAYEQLGWRGLRVLEEVIRRARELDLFVIVDAKAGDEGEAGRAYARAWLGKTNLGAAQAVPFGGDCLTVNGYLGSEALRSVLEVCREEDKCFFALVKTAGAGAGELQDMVAGDRLVCQVVGDLTARLERETGQYGYSRAGAVVAAAYPSDLRALRKRLEHTFFLVPGYAPGMAQDLRFAFDPYGRGALLTAAAPVALAWRETGGDYREAAREAVRSLTGELRRYVTIL